MSMRARCVLVALMAAGLTGCTDEPEQELPEVRSLEQSITLQHFDSCSQLERYIEDTAVLDMRSQLVAYRDQSDGWGWGPPVFDEETAAGAPSRSGSAAPSAWTETNTQVAGVDEADFVKNDGTRIFALSGGNLYVIRSWPADQLAILSKVSVEGWPQEMFLDQDRVVVFSSVYHRYDWAEPVTGAACDWNYCNYYYGNTVKVTVLDVSDPRAPQVTREEYLPGSYRNARRVGGSVRLVLDDHFRWPAGVRWWLDEWPKDEDERRRAWDRLIAENERLIRAQTLAEWLPPARRVLADGRVVETGYQCSDFSRPNAPTQLGMLTIATLDLDAPEHPIQRTSVLAQTGEVYASATGLYVANWHWWWSARPGQRNYTYLHKFDISQPDRATYVGSGWVEGHILDQFSMDEHEGFFRVATTVTELGGAESVPRMWSADSWSHVSVFAARDGRLELVGRSPELARGERMYSSRFLGDRAFVVTFRQVDPLFAIDLSEPTAPRVVGELKVPGFSTYLHPVDENHLLAMGTWLPEPDSAGQTDWQERALKVTLFDVSDLANPREKFGVTVGTACGWSEAQYEHKAFNYFAQKGLLAIPFADWRPDATDYWSAFVSDLRVFRVDPETGITPLGALSMSDLYMSDSWNGWTYYWMPSVRRSVMADDFVYSISDAGIRSAHVGNLSAPLGTVRFDRR
jgi:hypothetical protein